MRACYFCGKHPERGWLAQHGGMCFEDRRVEFHRWWAQGWVQGTPPAPPARTSQCWSQQTPAWTQSVHLDAPGQRHGQKPVSGTAEPGVVKQDKASRGSVDTTKTRSDPQRVRMSSGERPIGAAKGKRSDTEALCQPPPPSPPCFRGKVSSQAHEYIHLPQPTSLVQKSAKARRLRENGTCGLQDENVKIRRRRVEICHDSLNGSSSTSPGFLSNGHAPKEAGGPLPLLPPSPFLLR